MHICRVQRLTILPQVLLVFFCIRANSEVSSNFQSFYKLSCSHFFLNTSASNPLLKKSPNYFLFRVCLLTLTNNSKFPDHISRNYCTLNWYLCIFVLLLSEGLAGEAWEFYRVILFSASKIKCVSGFPCHSSSFIYSSTLISCLSHLLLPRSVNRRKVVLC